MSEDVVREEEGWCLPVFNGLGVAQLLIDDSLTLRIGSHEIVLCAWAELGGWPLYVDTLIIGS